LEKQLTVAATGFSINRVPGRSREPQAGHDTSGDDARMKTRPLVLVLFAVVATPLLAWLSITSIGPAWVKTLAIVGVAVVGAFAQSFVDWVRERAKAQRKASTPGGAAAAVQPRGAAARRPACRALHRP
jgi:hypothetical protein